MSGINRLDIYADGYADYLRDRGVTAIGMDFLEGSASYEEAEKAIRKQIDDGYPIPALVLNHRDRTLKDYVWHWFLINGYEEHDDTLMVKAVTYSSYQWLELRRLWNTGYANKGGLILYKGSGLPE